jgi:hypothetical protein
MSINERDLKNFIDGLLIGLIFGAIVSAVMVLIFT